MIYSNPRIQIESGDGTTEILGALSEEGYGVAFINSCEPREIGIKRPRREDYDYRESEVVWLFKNKESLDVIINVLNELRSNMEDFENKENK